MIDSRPVQATPPNSKIGPKSTRMLSGERQPPDMQEVVPMRVTFDSNAWEKIFADEVPAHPEISSALLTKQLQGFICTAAFRIEAIRKRDRPDYFSEPYSLVRPETPVRRNGVDYYRLSFGPDDAQHPGIPPVQAAKLRRALSAGIKLLHGNYWLGLPSPPEISNSLLYVEENAAEERQRVETQLSITDWIDAQDLGFAAFEAADGWSEHVSAPRDAKKLSKACAEWADGELVAAHIAYGNHILCTDDQAVGAGRSIFDQEHRAWLTTEFGVIFMGVDDLEERLKATHQTPS